MTFDQSFFAERAIQTRSRQTPFRWSGRPPLLLGVWDLGSVLLGLSGQGLATIRAHLFGQGGTSLCLDWWRTDGF